MKFLFISIFSYLLIVSCNGTQKDFDASGTFESLETIISTESAGTIMQFNIEEGQTLNPKQYIGYIDTTQLFLKKKQIEAQIDVIDGQKPNIPIQIAALQEQLKEAEVNYIRAKNLVKGDAAPQKLLDDASVKVEVLKKQIEAQKSVLDITSETFNRNVPPLQRQIAQINDQLLKCRIINPIHGTVLTKYAQAFEVAMPGKVLYKIAELDTLTLRVYITGSQLSSIKLGQKVTVRTDNGATKLSDNSKEKKDGYREYPGNIYWISNKSEFTPKTVQTKEERVDLVYAIKVRVANDGFLKIGMYGEIIF
jgi:HlyD family secretion protein